MTTTANRLQPVPLAIALGACLAYGPARGGDPGSAACMSIGGGATQFSSTCDTCVVSDGAATIDRDESTYGTLEIVTAGSGTMRATAQSGVVFPAGSSVGFLESISGSGHFEMLLRTYENNVLQEEFVVNLSEHPEDLVSFKTTRQYDAVEFSVSQFDPDTDPEPPFICYADPPVCAPSNGHRVSARIHEFCSGPDTTPDAFTFSDQTGVEPGATVTSAPVTITGIEAPTSIWVTGGEYSIGCTATYTASTGSVSNDQLVCVRHTAAAGFGSSKSTLLKVGGVSDWFVSTTRAEDAPDVTPDAFTFIDQTGVEPGAQVTSAPVTITGIEAPAAISVSEGEYSIGCTSTYTASAGNVSNGQTVCVRHTAAAGFGGQTSTLLTVGGVSDWFVSTTRAEDAPDVTPDAFTFIDQTGVEPGAQVTSAPVTITGIEAPAAISVSGGEYSIGCTSTFTSAGGTIANNQTVCVRHPSAPSSSTATDTTLTVGGVSDTFTSTTAGAPPVAVAEGGGGGALGQWLLGLLAGVAGLRRRLALNGRGSWALEVRLQERT